MHKVHRPYLLHTYTSYMTAKYLYPGSVMRHLAKPRYFLYCTPIELYYGELNHAVLRAIRKYPPFRHALTPGVEGAR